MGFIVRFNARYTFKVIIQLENCSLDLDTLNLTPLIANTSGPVGSSALSQTSF